MVYIIDLLSDVQAKHIKDFYNFSSFGDGKDSGASDREFKHNEYMNDEMHYPKLFEYLGKIVSDHYLFNLCFVPYKFTKPLFLKYSEGMHYDYHLDLYYMQDLRTDWSVTCFLSDPSEYEGGELVLKVTQNEEISYKLEPGKAVIYPSGTLHKVNPVTSGERKVVVFWFESLLKTSFGRRIVADYSMALHNLNPHMDSWSKDNVHEMENIRHQMIREYA